MTPRGNYQTGRALTEITRGMALTDAWTQNQVRPSYTHNTSNGTCRLDQFYVTGNILPLKLGIETLPAAFTDHHGVLLCISVRSFEIPRGWCRWKMNPHMMEDEGIKLRVRHKNERWDKYRQYYPDVISWWERCVKKRLR